MAIYSPIGCGKKCFLTTLTLKRLCGGGGGGCRSILLLIKMIWNLMFEPRDFLVTCKSNIFCSLWLELYLHLKKCPAASLHFLSFPPFKKVWWFASSTDIGFGLIYHMVEVIIPGDIGFFNYQHWWHKYQRNGKINKMSGRTCTMKIRTVRWHSMQPGITIKSIHKYLSLRSLSLNCLQLNILLINVLSIWTKRL